MKKQINKRAVAFILSLLILFGNVSPSYASYDVTKAMLFDDETSISTLSQTSQTKGGALPVNQVDLGTGNVTLHESLLAVEGYQAKLTYNSEGVAQKAITWNRTQKQGTMGLGWEYPENRIIRLTKQTGTLEDDSFMLYMEGASYPLLYISTQNGEKEYRFAKQHDWIVKHHLEQDQWRLYMPSGQIYVFGDGSFTAHRANSEENNVRWGNWIGSSTDPLGQRLLPMSYNISAIEDIYGEQVQFFYENIRDNVGAEGKAHTKASYISKVIGLRGKILHFIYEKKRKQEYSDPHTENGVNRKNNDRDAYQERYEDQYLSAIELKNRNKELIKKISFKYDALNKNTELEKRLLTTINYLDSKEDPYMPSKTFDYFGINKTDGVFAGLSSEKTNMFNSKNGALYGAIKQENLPEGVSYGYHYGKQKIKGSSKSLQINFPANPYNKEYDVTSRWSAPELFYGSDYVVAIFESQDLTNRQSYVRVYQWVGDRWIEKDLGAFDGYFYDRYFAKDQYNKGLLKKLKGKIFDQLGTVAPGAAGALTAINDVFTDAGKTIYKVGDDLHDGKVGKAIKDWFQGEANIFKDIVLDIAASLEKEAEQIKTFFDTVFNNKKGLFTDHQKKLYEAREKDLGENPRKSYHVTLQDNFFALTSSWGGSQVVIVNKNTLSPGEWSTNKEGANISSKFFTFESGDNFIALLDEVTDFLYIYSWDGLIWNTHFTKLSNDFNAIATATQGKNDLEMAFDSLLGENGEAPEEKLDHRSAISAKNNMILAVITDSHGINADITLFHHDENMNWTHTGTNINKKAAILGTRFSFDTGNQLSRFSGFFGKDAKIDVKVGNSFAVLQTYDNADENLPDVNDIPIVGSLVGDFIPDTKKINSTYGIVWDENFDNIRLTHLHSAIAQTGTESFIVGDVINKIGKAHNLLVGSNNAIAPDDGKNYAFRYTGNNFVSHRFESPYYTSGFSNDVTSTLIESNDKSFKTPQFYQFDPNTNQWGIINNTSKEQISAPGFVDEAINVSVEIINIIVQVVTLIIPGAGEALELAESTLSTLKTVESVANVAGLVTMAAGPIAKELTKEIMGTNHKSTSIANNYISVNGKLFHRQPSSKWIQVTNDEFQLNDNIKLVGGTNNVVNSFIPYTLNNRGKIENHVKLLRNGKVYNSKQLEQSDYIIHQDSVSTTIGAGAYVSYGPVNPKNGYVKENAYVKQFLPVIGSSADVRSRRTRPAYKDATKVKLHKIIGTSFEDDLYDYPVVKVAITEGISSLGNHYYQYDGNSAAHDSHSQITFYGKVTDIPTSKEYSLSSTIDLSKTDGGYMEHYYYNKYNTYNKNQKGTGHLLKPSVLKISNPKNFVTYESSYSDDQTSFKNGNVNVLYGHPYASLIHNTSQKIVSSNHTYYKVWEQDLRHQLNGELLQETKTYDVRPIKKIKTTDGVAHQTQYEYGYNLSSLVLRKKTVDGIAPNGDAEFHRSSYVYASEHYDDLRLVNRVKEHFMTVQSVQQGTKPEKVTNADVITYETFKGIRKEILAPKHFYKAISPNNPQDLLVSMSNIPNPTGNIVQNIVHQDQKEARYDAKTALYHNAIRDYHGTERALHDAQGAQQDLLSEIEQLNAEIHVLGRNIEGYQKIVSEDDAQINAIHNQIQGLHNEINGFNNRISSKQREISNKNRAISNHQRDIGLAWIGGPLPGLIAVGIIQPKIDSARDDINSLRSGINQLHQNITQKNNEIHTKRVQVNNLTSAENELKSRMQAFILDLKEDKVIHTSLTESSHNILVQSQEASKGSIKSFDKVKHLTAKTSLDQFKNSTSSPYLLYKSRLNSLKSSASALPLILTVPISGQSSSINYKPNFQSEMVSKINSLQQKLDTHVNHAGTMSNHHQTIIGHGDFIQSSSNGVDYNYTQEWIKTKTIKTRDRKTGIPLVWTDTDEVPSSIVLHEENKKPVASYRGLDAHSTTKTNVVYYGFEDNKKPQVLSNAIIIDEGHTGNKSLKFTSQGGAINELNTNPSIQYMVSAWIKPDNDSNASFYVSGTDIRKVFKSDNQRTWKYVEFLIDKGVQPTINGSTNLLIDDLLIRPLDTRAKIAVWDNNDILYQEIANNGLTTTHILNDAQQHIASLDNTKRINGFTHHGYSRHYASSYDQNQPNKNINIHFQGKGTFLGNPSGTTTISNEQFGSSYAISFIANNDFEINNGGIHVQKVGKLIKASSLDYEIGANKDILILVHNGIFKMYVEGKLIESKSTSILNTTIQGEVNNLLVGQNPVINVTYKDGLTREIQHQYWHNNIDNEVTGKVVTGVTYNGWGKPIVHTKPLFHLNSILNYEPDFVNYNYQNQQIEGNFINLYNSFSEQNQRDYVNPNQIEPNQLYTEIRYSNDPLQRVIASLQPGVNNIDEENTKRTGYQDALGASLEVTAGITNKDKLSFVTTSSQIRNNDKAKVTDLFGRITASQNGNSISSYSYEYDASGNKKTHRRLPLSHVNNNPNQYKNSRVKNDLLGDQMYTETIDEGTNYVIKNKDGLPIFSSVRDFSPSESNIQWSYIKYDAINRPIESGIATVPGIFNAKKMSLLANVPEWLGDIKVDMHKTWKYDSSSEARIPAKISQSAWTLHHTDSFQPGAEATKAFDGDSNTLWHSNWSTTDRPPHDIEINLGAVYSISELRYLPRQNGSNGRIKEYEVYVTDNLSNWGTPVTSGSWLDTADEKVVNFPEKSGKYIRLRELSEVNDNAWASAAEINVYGIDEKQFQNTFGKVTQTTRMMNGKSVETKYSYNERGQVVLKANYIASKLTGQVRYHYNPDGKTKNIVYPNGINIFYSYDLNGKLQGIGNSNNHFAYVKYGYGINGKVTNTIYGDRLLTRTKKYTLQEHLSECKTELQGESESLFKESFEYTSTEGNYHNGMIMSKTEKQEFQPTDTYKYTYDNQYRLIHTEQVSVTGLKNEHRYTYNVNGNMLSETSDVFNRGTGFDYKTGTNKLESVDEAANEIGLYTKIGSTPLGIDTRLAYDPLTRKVSEIYRNLDEKNQKVSFIYDTNNKRVRKTRDYQSLQGGVTVKDQLTYVAGTRNLPVYESYINNKDTDKNWDKVYIYGLEYAPIGMIHKGKTYYFVRDYQSSLRNVVDASTGFVAETYRYTPYGEIAYSNGTGTQTTYNLGTYLYTGQEYDITTGLYNYKARLYHPKKKIFLSPDPKHINYSPYTYTNNNPINFVDKDGKAPTYATAEPLGVLEEGYVTDVQLSLNDEASFKPFEAIPNLEQYQVNVDKGWFSNSATYLDGSPLPKKGIYTLNNRGDFFVADATKQYDGDLIHPRIAKGKVVSAGEVSFENGQLKSIDDQSGHFRPYDRAHLAEERLNELQVPKSKDFKLGKASIAHPGSEPIPASKRSLQDIGDHRLRANAKVNSLKTLGTEEQGSALRQMKLKLYE